MIKSLKQLRERIEQSNDAFNKMTDAEKRVEIARDTLLRININKFNFNRTCTVDGLEDYTDSDYESVKDIINTKSIPECTVCAKGAMFLSYVGRVNDFIIGDIDDFSCSDSSIVKKLNEIFELDQMHLIETAFETSIIHDDEMDKPLYAECEKVREIYRSKYWNKKDRLKSICKNIIKNNGTFVPQDLVNPNARIK
mgnify:CR=1 FL=1